MPHTAPYAAVIQAPFGVLALRTRDGHLTGIDFLPLGSPLRPPETALTQRVALQLAAYFRNPATVFDLPLAPEGTPYRQRVWQAVRDIACGQTRTYGELAALLHSAPRAVGQAVGDNPLPIIVPCHRVVARRGLGGFDHASNGYCIEIKRWLLRHEGALG
jgi:methylated-DNA-[protein]-cysteine S-methyltransferase